MPAVWDQIAFFFDQFDPSILTNNFCTAPNYQPVFRPFDTLYTVTDTRNIFVAYRYINQHGCS